MNAICLPEESTICGWQTNLRRSDDRVVLTGGRTARFVVIGAGFTGLAAARRLAELFPQESICLIDALGVGDGAAGRNCGFVVPIAHFRDENDSADQRLYRLGLAGLHKLEQLVGRFGIPCDWQNCGRLIAARGRFALRNLSHQQRALDQLGAPNELLDGEQVNEMTGMSGYRRAVCQRDAVLVNPKALVTGLAAHLPENVQLFEQTPVHRLGTGRHVKVECAHGCIRAEHVLLTTNGWLASQGLQCGRVFPMRTFASFAEVLDDAALPGTKIQWGLTSSLRIGSSLRRLSASRVLIRNTAMFGTNSGDPKRELNRVAAFHQRCLGERFPGFGSWKISNTWSGVLGVTANGAGFFGQADKNIWAAAGHNGHGIAQGTIAGRLLADLVSGRANSLLNDMQSLPQAQRVPTGSLLRAGVALSVGYLNFRGRKEF
ncbi:MAG: NAD(P)/FAD-dependent oxidoreductase [Pirellulaceae bacterium]